MILTTLSILIIKVMNDLAKFELIWCLKGALCEIFIDFIIFLIYGFVY